MHGQVFWNPWVYSCITSILYHIRMRVTLQRRAAVGRERRRICSGLLIPMPVHTAATFQPYQPRSVLLFGIVTESGKAENNVSRHDLGPSIEAGLRPVHLKANVVRPTRMVDSRPGVLMHRHGERLDEGGKRKWQVRYQNRRREREQADIPPTPSCNNQGSIRKNSRHVLFLSPEARRGNDAVDGGSQTKQRRPHVYDQNRRPRSVDRQRTSRYRPDIVSCLLDQVMSGHYTCRQENAETKLRGGSDSAFSSTGRGDGHAFCVEYVCHVSENTRQCTVRGHTQTKVEFDLDVTEYLALPPQLRLVRRPYQCVDGVLEVQDRHTQDEHGGCKVLALDVYDQRREG